MSDNLTIHVLTLAEYKSPVITESNRKDWVEYGEDNDYYKWLIDRFHKSPTNNAVINNMSRLIYGRGLSALDASRKPNDYAQLISLISPTDLRNVALELKMLGQGHFQVHYNDKHDKVVKAYHIPTALIRPEKCNEDGEIDGFYYSDNWEDVRKFEPKRIPAFGTSKEKIEILCIRSYSVGLKYFSAVDYQGCLPYCVLEEEVADYLINEVQNGFSGTKVVNFNNGIPSEEVQEETKNKVLRKLTGSKGEKVIVAFNNNAESKTTVEDIPLNDAPEHYTYLSTECTNKILVGHNVTSPMLIGVVTDNQGFSSNADEIEISAKYFYNTAIRPFQDLIIEGIDKILAFNNISLDLYFKRLNLLEDVEQEQQAKEENSLNMSKDLDTILAGFGEDESEEWELIDSRDVNIDLEDNLNAQVKEWEQSLKQPKSLLSKLINLVGTGRANPNKASKQDEEIDGFYFKVRYKYEGSTDGERPFCNAMLRANKLYTREDIERINSEVVNKGHGHKGQPYDLFKYKGGVNCSHVWRRKTYVSTTKNASIDSSKTSAVSNASATKFGYKVDNPSETSIEPRYMKYEGHHPDWVKENIG